MKHDTPTECTYIPGPVRRARAPCLRGFGRHDDMIQLPLHTEQTVRYCTYIAKKGMYVVGAGGWGGGPRYASLLSGWYELSIFDTALFYIRT